MNPLLVLATLLIAGIAGGAFAADKPRPEHIGMSISSLANPYFVALTRGAQERARQLNPQVKLTARSAEYDVPRQIAQIRELMGLNIDLLIVSASTEDGLAAILQEARKKGIVVIGADVRAKGASQTVLTDNLQAGQKVCDYLARAINGKGTFLIQNGPQVSSVLDRVSGCKQALAAYPGIRLLSDKEDGKASVWGGHASLQESLKRYPQIDAVFTINDRQALGSLQALREAGQTHTLIGSVDGSAAAVKEIAGGGQIIVSASQSPETMGRRAIDMGVALLKGARPEAELELLGTTLVTRDNAATFIAWDASKPGH